MSAPTTLLLIRHAEVEARYQGVFGGRIDMDISPCGHEQAAALASHLQHAGLDAIFASPMKRVQQTLAPLRELQVPAPDILPNLYEVDFGDWTGLTFEEVKKRYGCDAHHWLDLLEAGRIPNAENVPAFRSRIESCLKEILHARNGQAAAVCCHGGVIRMLLALLLHLPFAEMDRFEIEYTSITTVVIKPDRTRIKLLNFTPWRDLNA